MIRLSCPFRLALLAAPLALAAALPAQETTAPTSKIRQDATKMSLPAGSLPLKDVVDAAATLLGINILYDERELQEVGRSIALQTPMTIVREQAEAVVSDLVYHQGFALAPRNGDNSLYDLVSMQGPRAREILQLATRRTPEQVLLQPTLKQPVTTIVQLQNIDVSIATNALRPFVAAYPKTLTLGTTGGVRTLLISGIQNDVAKIIALLRESDTPEAAAAAAEASPVAAPWVHRQIGDLEQAVEQLQKQVAELRQRLAAAK